MEAKVDPLHPRTGTKGFRVFRRRCTQGKREDDARKGRCKDAGTLRLLPGAGRGIRYGATDTRGKAGQAGITQTAGGQQSPEVGRL